MGGFSGSANSVLIANNDAVQVALTGTGSNTTETILKTVNIPALGSNSSIDIDTLFSWTASANTKTFRIRLGGIGGSIICAFAETTTGTRQHKTIVRNVNSTSSQKFFNNSTSVGYGVSGVAINTGSIDTSVATTLVFTGQLDALAAAALNVISYEGSTVKVIL